MKKTNYGIYKIVNKDNGKYYVGRTLNLNKRWYQHKNLLIKNKHFNRYLQFAWNKYGENNFEFVIVEYVNNKEDLINIEQKYINEFITQRQIGIDNCYNLSENANSPMDINKGKKHSDKTKKLLSQLNKGREPWNKNKRLKPVDSYTSKISKKKYGVSLSKKNYTKEQRSLISKKSLNRPDVLLKFKQPRKPLITAKNIFTNEIKTLGRMQWSNDHNVYYRKLLKGYTSNGWKMVDRVGLEPTTDEL